MISCPLSHSLPVLSFLMIFTGLSPMASAEVYRWVDEQGVTQFSQTPPRSQTYDTVKVPSQPQPDPAAEEKLKRDAERAGEWQRSRKAKQEKQRAESEQEEQRRKNCETARSNLDTLENLGTRMLQMPDGQYVRPTEEDVEKRKQEAQKAIGEFCK